MSSIADLKYAGTGPLRPFLAICLGCGIERELNLDDEIQACECGVRRWGISACDHCRGNVGTA